MRILKVGGSAITDKSGYRKAIPEMISSMAQAIAEVWSSGVRDLVVVHGAGSFGHALVIKHGIDDGVRSDEQRLGFADTHAACSELSLMLVKELIGRRVPAVSIPPSAIIRQDNRRITEFDEDVVFGYLGQGYLPVLYGDMVPDESLGGSVCSGDQIMARLGKKAEFLVFATNVDGVLDDQGKLIEEITNESFSEISRHLKHSGNDVTGAMRGKIQELLELEAPSFIVNGSHRRRIISALQKKKTKGTVVRAHQSS